MARRHSDDNIIFAIGSEGHVDNDIYKYLKRLTQQLLSIRQHDTLGSIIGNYLLNIICVSYMLVFFVLDVAM